MSLDLNLLVHLDALLTEAHVTRAARRVGLTQPAMSRSLGRLREALGDPLLVRTGRGLEATPRGRALAGPVRRVLTDIEGVLLDRPRFDPPTAERTFTVGTTDLVESLLLPGILARLSREAPRVGVAVVGRGRELSALLLDGTVELVVTPRRGSEAGLVWRRLLSERFTTIVRRGHPRAGRRRLALRDYLALGHVVVAPGGLPGSVVDDALARLGHRRRVAARVASFLVAPFVVADSDLVATIPSRLAERASTVLPLRCYPPPLTVPGFDLFLGWHERHRADAGHTWVREVVAAVAKDL